MVESVGELHPGRGEAMDKSFALVTVDSNGESGSVWLSYADLQALHGHLGALLGLGIPTPTSPLTASVPAANATKEARNAQ